MTKIVGQAKLMSAIGSYTKQSLPKTLMLVGPAGCGKHTVSKYLAEKFEFDYVEIEESVTIAELEEFLYKTIDTLYVINLNKFSEKQQNQFLKFIEEPSKSTYILLIANSEVGVLNTVLNRCTKHYFEPYTKEQLEQITNTSINDLAFKIFQTPGKLLNLTDSSFKDILELAGKVVHSINHLTYANTIAISTNINYKDLYNKIDFTLFFDAVEYLAFEDFKNNNVKQSLKIFNVTNRFKQYASQTNFIKETLMLNYLTNLWEAVQV
jgi:replication-associated recombination protein RarA